jgi:hypothetical protein
MDLKDLAEAWIIMWGVSYIAVALIAPSISDVSPVGYGVLGGFILFCVFMKHIAYDRLGYLVMAGAFFALGIAETYGGVVSWTGAGLWNVPFPNKELFQVSMAFADMLSAVFLFLLSFEMARKTKSK